MHFTNLGDWLRWQESLSPQAIDLSLDRVLVVANRLGLLKPTCPVITVSGTNGKGSVVAMLSAMFKEAGHTVGAYTSPHLLRYNERVRVNGEDLSDERLCAAFAAIEQVRDGTRLTYFEFGTLAALWCFREAQVAVMILEVGLGGRLDAVNIMDADVAVITTIDLDHADWLGDTRELVAREKVGIQRPGKPLICGDRHPPESLLCAVSEVGSRLMYLGRDFEIESVGNHLLWRHHGREDRLPVPNLHGAFQAANAACACMALVCLQTLLPVSDQARDAGLTHSRLAGRFESLPGFPCQVVCDVAHNPQAAGALATQLAEAPVTGRNLAVFSSLAGKDVKGMVSALDPLIPHWFVSGLTAPRGLPAGRIREDMGTVQGEVNVFETVTDAFNQAVRRATPEDRIVVFGSFLTVAAVYPARV